MRELRGPAALVLGEEGAIVDVTAADLRKREMQAWEARRRVDSVSAVTCFSRPDHHNGAVVVVQGPLRASQGSLVVSLLATERMVEASHFVT